MGIDPRDHWMEYRIPLLAEMIGISGTLMMEKVYSPTLGNCINVTLYNETITITEEDWRDIHYMRIREKLKRLRNDIIKSSKL